MRVPLWHGLLGLRLRAAGTATQPVDDSRSTSSANSGDDSPNGNPGIAGMSKFLPEKSNWWLSLLGPAMVLWNQEPSDTFWDYTAPWSLGSYLGCLVFITSFRWFEGFCRRKLPPYGDPIQYAVYQLHRRNLKLRKEIGGVPSPEPRLGSVDRWQGEIGGITARTVRDMMAIPAGAFTTLEIGIRYYLWRFSSDYTYEADHSGPLLDELLYAFRILGFWSVVFGVVGVMVYRSRGIQNLIWDVLPEDVAEKYKNLDRLHRENKELRAARKELKRTRGRR